MKVNIGILVGNLLLVAGLLAVVFGGFSYPTESHTIDLGPAELSVQAKETVNVPLWAGGSAIAVGALVLALSRRSSTS